MNKIEEFVNSFPVKQTKKTYKMHLKNYFKTIKADPNTYFNNNRDYEKDVTLYWQQIQKYAPLTRISRLSCVRTFLEENNITIPSKTWKKFRKRSKGTRAITLDKAPSNQELKQILTHADIMTKTIALISSSSGMRINEVLMLQPEDIKINKDILEITIRPEISKTGQPRICYASSESKQLLDQWNNIRDKWYQSSLNRIKGLQKYHKRTSGKKTNDTRIFPLDYSCFDRKWIRCLQKSKFDERDLSTGYYKLHFHTLRKFFETRMSYAGIPDPIYQQLQGHEGYLNGAYKRYTQQELESKYREGMKELLVFETSPDLTGVNEEIAELREENKELTDRIKELEMEYRIFTNLKKKLGK